VINSALFYRVNENWGLRASHYYDVGLRRMQEQDYAIYRDLRSWTAALVFRLREDADGKNDFTVAFTFSLKAHPTFGLGEDTVKRDSLLGI